MEQLTPLDAVFLSIETRHNPTHVGGLALLDPNASQDFDFESFRDFVSERIALCPRFSWRLQTVPLGGDLPYWVEGGELEIERHVQRVAVPSPGNREELLELVGLLYGRPLDRTRPLWEMYFIENLQGRRCALLWKMHHSLVDGVSAAGLMELLFDLQPEPGERPLVPVDETRAGDPARFGDMLRHSVSNATKRPGAFARHLRHLGADAIRGLGDERERMPQVPRVSFNGEVGPRRAVAWSCISLTQVKELKRALGVTVNDVVLALTSGAVRRYLEERDELPGTPLVAMVPISTRASDDKSIGNQIMDAPVNWGTHIEDPLERVAVIHDAMRRVKRRKHGSGVIPLLAESLPPAMAGLAMRVVEATQDSVPLISSAIVSNVPSSPVPLYVAGARLEALVPLSILSPTQGLNITALSYCDEMHFGLTVDPDLLPDPGALADGIAKSVLELQEALSRA